MLAGRPASRRAAAKSGREKRIAGQRPNAKPVPTATSAVKANTALSILTFDSKGISAGPSATNTSTPQNARTTPASPPPILTSMLSVSSCAMIRLRGAPRATRMAIYLDVAAALTRNKLATLVLAIRSTTPTVAKSRSRAGRTSWTT